MLCREVLHLLACSFCFVFWGTATVLVHGFQDEGLKTKIEFAALLVEQPEAFLSEVSKDLNSSDL